jgi:UDP-N-acetylmuramate dehydrogenase
MSILENHSLKSLNTFGVDVTARWFARISSTEDLQRLITDAKWRDVPKLILGGGSNILFTGDFPGLVMHNNMKGITDSAEDGDQLWLKVAAGEVWHDLVLSTMNRGLGGLENLSLIPGLAGAAPIQNIGAYGAELSEVLDEVEAVRLLDGKVATFSNSACRFGYRTSVFKTELAGQYMITSITLRFDHKHQVNTRYGAVAETLKAMGVNEPSIRDVSEAVIRIRRSKLPDPAQVGNAGSFFKNPVLDPDTFERLRLSAPDIPAYREPGGNVKVPAAWLIEKAGWKGKRVGKVGMHERQALVLVNYGGATGRDLHQHALTVKRSVAERFSIDLEEEVRVV